MLCLLGKKVKRMRLKGAPCLNPVRRPIHLVVQQAQAFECGRRLAKINNALVEWDCKVLIVYNFFSIFGGICFW